MPTVDVVVECPIFDSFRVAQIAGMFDVAVAEKCRRTFSVELPGMDESWEVGAIVGPSGSGKTSVARQAFGGSLYQGFKWSREKAVIDGFGRASIDQITEMLTAVGFSSPPSWIKPYHALSNGEQFRCELARSLLGRRPLVVFDEFTSVVDRTVAKIGSAAVSKAIRRSQGQRFVAVTCHYDVVEWLEVDWVLDMSTGQLARGRLRRPAIRLEVFRCERAAWRVFGPHHYLSSNLAKHATCFLATWQQEPVAMVGVLNAWGYPGYQRISRIVVLPDYQGIGIARRVLDAVCGHLIDQGAKRVGLTTGHPAMIRSLQASNQWRCEQVAKQGGRHAGLVAGKRVPSKIGAGTNTAGRCVVRFCFKPNEAELPKTIPVDLVPETDRPGWLRPKSTRSRKLCRERRRTAGLPEVPKVGNQ